MVAFQSCFFFIGPTLYIYYIMLLSRGTVPLDYFLPLIFTLFNSGTFSKNFAAFNYGPPQMIERIILGLFNFRPPIPKL